MICLECGLDGPEFCCKEHKTEFDKRRYTRGALLADLVMLGRYAKKHSKERILQDVYAISSIWRDEDKSQRAGRQSWRVPKSE